MSDLDSENQEHQEPLEQSQSVISVFVSVVCAFIGVQSSRRARRDFHEGKLWHYVVVAIVLAVLFVLILISVVRLVI